MSKPNNVQKFMAPQLHIAKELALKLAQETLNNKGTNRTVARIIARLDADDLTIIEFGKLRNNLAGIQDALSKIKTFLRVE